MQQRYIVELGTGADLHGANMTKAACRAVKDAISRSCLCGLVEILGRGSFQGVHVHARIAVPEPDLVDKEAVLAVIPIGEKSIEVVAGGLRTRGLEVACFSPGCSDIVLACAALTVSVDID